MEKIYIILKAEEFYGGYANPDIVCATHSEEIAKEICEKKNRNREIGYIYIYEEHNFIDKNKEV